MKTLILLLLLVASPLAAQNPICTQSRTSALVGKSVVFSPADSGTIITTYASRDTQVDKCTKVLRLAKGSVVVPPVVDTVNPPKDTAVVVVMPPGSRDTYYFNSSDPACSATALLCDDFEDGVWYDKNFDQMHGDLLSQDGWGGTIYGPVTPAVCGNAGVKSNCAASHGTATGGAGGVTMADHSLAKQANDLYVRFYTKALPGYLFGAEKVLSFNAGPAGTGGIYHGNLHLGCGSEGGKTSQALQWQPTDGTNCKTILTVTSGRWYYIEVHLTVSTGALEVWADDCGAAGTTCPASPTKRLTTTVGFGQGRLPVGSLWWENWANPGSKGTRLIDEIVVDTKFIGFRK